MGPLPSQKEQMLAMQQFPARLSGQHQFAPPWPPCPPTGPAPSPPPIAPPRPPTGAAPSPPVTPALPVVPPTPVVPPLPLGPASLLPPRSEPHDRKATVPPISRTKSQSRIIAAAFPDRRAR